MSSTRINTCTQLEWFFTRRNFFMVLHIVWCPEGLVTIWHCVYLSTVFTYLLCTSWKYLITRNTFCTWHTRMVFHQFESFHVNSSCMLPRRSCHTLTLHLLNYLLCSSWMYLIINTLFAHGTLTWFFTSLNPFMFLQSSYCQKGIVTI